MRLETKPTFQLLTSDELQALTDADLLPTHDSVIDTYLPYGVCIEDNGDETLFNRDYRPLFSRNDDRSKVWRTSGSIDYGRVKFFYVQNRAHPHTNSGKFAILIKVLQSFFLGEDVVSYAIYSTDEWTDEDEAESLVE